MAIGASTLDTAGKSNADQTSYTSASVAFSASAVYFLWCEYSHATINAPPPSSIVTTGVTWTLIKDLPYKLSGGNRTGCAVYWGVGSGSATTTINFGYTAQGCLWAITHRFGVHQTTPVRTGTPIKTLVAAPAPAGTATITLDAYTNSSSRAYAMLGGNYNSTSYTVDPDWATDTYDSQPTPTEALVVANATAETVFTITNGSASSNAIGLIGFEILPGPVSVPLGLRPGEIGHARALAPTKTNALARQSEADAARGLAFLQSLALARASETDTARAVAASKTSALGRAAELDVVRAVSATSAKALGRANETDSIRALTATKSVALARIGEADAVRALGFGSRSLAIGRLGEVDTARTLSASKTIVLGRVEGIDSARAVGFGSRSLTLARIAEADNARSVGGAKTAELARSFEADNARALGFGTRSLGLLRVGEADAARPLSRSVALGRIGETDGSRTLSGTKTTVVGRLGEADSTRSVGRAVSTTLQRIFEVGAARAILASKTAPLLRVPEVDGVRALGVTGGTPILRLGEIDATRALGASKTFPLGRLGETDGARALANSKTTALTRVAEVDGSRVVGIGGPRVVSYQGFVIATGVVTSTILTPLGLKLGNSLILTFRHSGSGTSNITTVVDSAGNTWTCPDPPRGGVSGVANTFLSTAYCHNPVGVDVPGYTITVGHNNGSSKIFAILEVALLANAAPDIATEDFTHTTSTNVPASSAATTTRSGDFIVGAASYTISAGSATGVTAGWTLLPEFTTTNGRLAVAYKIASQPGAEQAQFSGPSATAYGGGLIAFRAAGRSLAVARAGEASSARAAGSTKTSLLGRLGETSAVRAVLRAAALLLGRAGETDLTRPVGSTSAVTLALGRIGELDGVRTVFRSSSAPIARVGETSASRTILRSKIAPLDRSGEADSARALGSGPRTFPIGRLGESSGTRPLGFARARALLRVGSAELARALGRARDFALERLGETDGTREITVPFRPPPEDRLLVVAAETRMLDVEAEDRVLVVGAEVRVCIAEDDERDRPVPAEARVEDVP